MSTKKLGIALGLIGFLLAVTAFGTPVFLSEEDKTKYFWWIISALVLGFLLVLLGSYLFARLSSKNVVQETPFNPSSLSPSSSFDT